MAEERLAAIEAELMRLRQHAEEYSAQVETIRVQSLDRIAAETQRIDEKAAAAVRGVQELYDQADVHITPLTARMPAWRRELPSPGTETTRRAWCRRSTCCPAN